ncbi:MAG: hypothetical protein ACRDFS_13395 [Chloroflexota bacterium]
MADQDFELLAASLRADAQDLSMFADVLADKLEAALPAETRVERKSKGIFSSEKQVRSVAIDLGDERYDLAVDKSRFEPRRAKIVRGIVLKTEPLSLAEWIDALSTAIASRAQRSEQAREALHRILGA